jgi:hypothetical protein
MNKLINHKDRLLFSWQPNCSFDKETGIYTTYVLDETRPSALADTIIFNIKFKHDSDNELYQELADYFEHAQNTDEIFVMLQPPSVFNEIKVKPEYQGVVDKINEKNQILLNKVSDITKQLQELGCNPKEFCTCLTPKLLTAPEECYEIVSSTRTTSAHIQIYCHEDTEFYQFLISENLTCSA